jgi:hypothetical protein
MLAAAHSHVTVTASQHAYRYGRWLDIHLSCLGCGCHCLRIDDSLGRDVRRQQEKGARLTILIKLLRGRRAGRDWVIALTHSKRAACERARAIQRPSNDKVTALHAARPRAPVFSLRKRALVNLFERKGL